MAISFLTGQRLTADLLNTNVFGYFPSTFTKAVATPRASTTTLASDDELTAIPLGVGTWEIELLGFFYTTTGGTQAIKTRWAMGGGGTWNGTAAIRSCIGPGADNVAATLQATTVHTRGYTLDTQDAVYQASATSIYTQIRECSRNVIVSVAGTMSIQWAQNSSSANATTLAAPSSVTIRKISA